MKRVDKQYLKSIEAEKILEVTVKGKNYKLKIEKKTVILKKIGTLYVHPECLVLFFQPFQYSLTSRTKQAHRIRTVRTRKLVI